MMTRIILSGIQEALEYQSMGMATMALGLNDNDHESNSFVSEERWLLNKGQEKSGVENKGRKKQREQGRSAARQSLAVFVCDCRHPAACSQNAPTIKTEQ